MMLWERVQLPVRQWQDGALRKVGEISGPGKRWGHTCNAVKEGRYLYVFGGYGKDNRQTNQVHVFDTARQTWSEPAIKGFPPTPRDSHTCTTIGVNLFIFGGTDGTRPLKDLLILDTSLNIWLHPRLRGEGPEAREGHGAALVGKQLFIFGGCGKSSNNVEVYYNDLYILDTEKFVWQRAITSGIPPSPRGSHTCSSWKNKFIVIGGEDAYDCYLSDVHILDTDTLNWMELSTSGQMLLPRAGHTSIAFEKHVFVFGGFSDSQNLYDDLYMLDLDISIWTKVLTSGDGPSARFSVAGACLIPQNCCVLAFIGGCDKSLEALDDMYFLNTGLAEEKVWKVHKLSLRKQLKLKCQEENQNFHRNKTLMEFGIRPNIYQPMQGQVNDHQSGRDFVPNQLNHPHGMKMFRANITENIINGGYIMETIIDGKRLRGILFSNKPKYIDVAHHSSRKRTCGETGSDLLNGDHNSKSKSSRVVRLDPINEILTVGVQEKASTSYEPQMNIALDLAPSIPSQPHKATPNTDLTMHLPSEPDRNQTRDGLEKKAQDKIGDCKNNLQDSKGNNSKENFVVIDDDTIALIPSRGDIMGVPFSNVADGKTEAAKEQESAT